ncbi:MAG TPA: ABC transporter ATP-binding protein [Pirellulales bacterium]|jgi:putative ABC transport system ATP-binding protein|nr:ABC transporter ATP-binding protein [Pirellulales bacterium]
MNDSSPSIDRPVLLQVEHASRLYPDGNVTALRDVSLTVHTGDYLSIMGPSGSGKSTLLNLMGAIDVPTSGEVYFEGESLAPQRRLHKIRAHKIGFIFQSFHLLPTLTALENVQIPMFEGSLSARQRRARAGELLELVGLAERMHHLPAQLSVGQRQRVAIARSLANDPPLLLADEPTGNLDSRSGGEVLDLFDRLHRQAGRTLVVITHSQEVAERAERIVHVRDGQIVSENGQPCAR